jgi:hypothetical protein
MVVADSIDPATLDPVADVSVLLMFACRDLETFLRVEGVLKDASAAFDRRQGRFVDPDPAA